MSHRNVEGIPFDVLAFLDEHIHSVEQLEILLLLRRTAPRAWSGTTVSGHLRGNAESADLRLQDLHARGLIACLDDAPPNGAPPGQQPLYYRPSPHGSPSLLSAPSEFGQLASTGSAEGALSLVDPQGVDAVSQQGYTVAPPLPAPLAASDSLDATLGRLEEAYATRRTRVIEIIFTKPPTALRDFADAFRLRRK